MDGGFFQDLFSTFRSVNDWIKVLIVVGFYGTILGVAYLIFRRPPRALPSESKAPDSAPRPPVSSGSQISDLREKMPVLPPLSSSDRIESASELPAPSKTSGMPSRE